MAATKQKKRAKDFINTSYVGRAFFFVSFGSAAAFGGRGVRRTGCRLCLRCGYVPRRHRFAGTTPRHRRGSALLLSACFLPSEVTPIPSPVRGSTRTGRNSSQPQRKKVLDIFLPLM